MIESLSIMSRFRNWYRRLDHDHAPFSRSGIPDVLTSIQQPSWLAPLNNNILNFLKTCSTQRYGRSRPAADVQISR